MDTSNLRQEIRQFQKKKMRFAVPIIIVGIMGLVLPVIPGIALILLGILLLFPLQGKRLIDRLRQYWHKIVGGRKAEQA